MAYLKALFVVFVQTSCAEGLKHPVLNHGKPWPDCIKWPSLPISCLCVSPQIFTFSGDLFD